MEALREQRENSISNTREELYSAQEEVLVLRHAMEAATAERERDIAALHGDLTAVTAELDKWRKAASKYEQEIGTLQENFKLQSQHQERALQLQGEHAGLLIISLVLLKTLFGGKSSSSQTSLVLMWAWVFLLCPK